MKTKRILQVSALALAMSVVTAQAADRIAFMDQGRILDISPAKEFFAHTANERVKQFLASYLAQFSYVV